MKITRAQLRKLINESLDEVTSDYEETQKNVSKKYVPEILDKLNSAKSSLVDLYKSLYDNKSQRDALAVAKHISLAIKAIEASETLKKE